MRLLALVLLCGCVGTRPWGSAEQQDHEVKFRAGFTTQNGIRPYVIYQTFARDYPNDRVESGTVGFGIEIGAK